VASEVHVSITLKIQRWEWPAKDYERCEGSFDLRDEPEGPELGRERNMRKAVKLWQIRGTRDGCDRSSSIELWRCNPDYVLALEYPGYTIP